MTTELTQKLENIISGHSINEDDADWLRALTQRPAAQEVDDGDITGQPGPLPETGWDEVPEGAFRKPSPTAGMNLGERIKHVGGRENAAGYIEFGSVAAVRALVRQYLRDLPAPQQATPDDSFVVISYQVNDIEFSAETRRVDENTVDIRRVVAFADERATPEPVGEPFGYFRALPFEWEQCGEHDEGAVALYTRPAPGVPEVRGVQWFAVAEHGLPDFDEEVIGGLWYTDPWLKPELATRFLWGLCRVLKDEHRDFNGGKRWQTFGPSHNQITHWARINMPALAAAQAKGGGQ